jgi:hypothetical protein
VTQKKIAFTQSKSNPERRTRCTRNLLLCSRLIVAANIVCRITIKSNFNYANDTFSLPMVCARIKQNVDRKMLD